MTFLLPAILVPLLTQATPPVVIPFLANATSAAEIGYEGAECTPGGSTMRCAFQQVFVTTSPVVPDTCLVTTNRYERIFRKESPERWTSTEGPTGACGILDIATLTDHGGVKWTMDLQKRATRKEAPECRAIDESIETLSWETIRRPLPCRFIQPGGLRP